METSPALFEHGIQTEKSDIRAHVAVTIPRVYVFRTREALKAMAQTEYPVRTASQPGVEGITAIGRLIPPADIHDCRILIPSQRFILKYWNFPKQQSQMSTSGKGAVAVRIVREMMRQGKFPVWWNVDEVQDSDIQISGTDIILFGRKLVQVKCDWYAGDPQKSGSLYLQVSERNPLKMI